MTTHEVTAAPTPTYPDWLDWLCVRPAGSDLGQRIHAAKAAGEDDWHTDWESLEEALASGNVAGIWRRYSWLLSTARRPVAKLIEEVGAALPRDDIRMVQSVAGRIHQARPACYEIDRGMNAYGAVIPHRCIDYCREILDTLFGSIGNGTTPEQAAVQAAADIDRYEDDMDVCDQQATALRSAVQGALSRLTNMEPMVLIHAGARSFTDTAETLYARFAPHILARGAGVHNRWSVIPACVAQPPVGVLADPLEATDTKEALDVAASLWVPQEYGSLSYPEKALEAGRILVAQ